MTKEKWKVASDGTRDMPHAARVGAVQTHTHQHLRVRRVSVCWSVDVNGRVPLMLSRRGATRGGKSRRRMYENELTRKSAQPSRTDLHTAGPMSPQALHHQIMRNAYIVAQSQLLQLAKQMEYDVDLSDWEDEAQEKMQEFWEQTKHNVIEFCSRMRYVVKNNALTLDPIVMMYHELQPMSSNLRERSVQR